MIPKIIHYCWFGRAELPPLAKKCIASWRKFCPDYEIIEWNEDNFDINTNKYIKEAYESKKMAFITDYVRLNVLFEYGGIYMDTDVEVVANLDPFLRHNAFSGFEDVCSIPTGIIGAQKGNLWLEYLLTYYKDRSFFLKNGNFDLTTNVDIITDMTKKKYDITLNNTMQYTNGDVLFYPKEYFCPKDFTTGIISTTEKTYAIHHFAGSWKPKDIKIKEKTTRIIRRNLGEKGLQIILNLNRIFFKKNKI
ncbi:glycosyl transferase [Paenibacillus sp. FSL R5-0345]|uniref:glycosyltransferase family 32 protein n=1 Tax=Paenibacillus sp. FSL R5-0345 TaxID=1536770 RepID=UPI0004F6EA8A|nr:glycosyltransferase [Paenibacillus sp. FSL R5-0345]AIQ37491.1 glycosyl transferase [Paenibacillus sp. FSL R5-0345]